MFDRIYISPAREDLEVFKAISNHPILSKSVHEIIYDCSEFSIRYSPRDWFYDFWFLAITQGKFKIKRARSPDSDARLLDCYNDICEKKPKIQEAWKNCEKQPFVGEHFRTWRGYAERQRSVQEDGTFQAELTSGLRAFSALHTISMNCWPPKITYGSPLGRSWKPYLPKPLQVSWLSRKESVQRGRPHGSKQYSLITKALAASQRRIQGFSTNSWSLKGPARALCPSRAAYISDGSEASGIPA